MKCSTRKLKIHCNCYEAINRITRYLVLSESMNEKEEKIVGERLFKIVLSILIIIPR